MPRRGRREWDTLSTNTLNGVRWADSPDDVHTQLQNLPSHGGVVALRPGAYTVSSDWTSTIDIPGPSDANAGTAAHYHINMGGSSIDVDGVPPDPMINRDTDGERAAPIEFVSPAVDGSNQSNADLGTFADLDDLQNHRIWIRNIEGEFDIVYRNEQFQGSGHQGRVFIECRLPDKGIVLDSDAAGPSNDRSWYWGQISAFGNKAVECLDARTNFFHVQPENNRGSLTGRTNAPTETIDGTSVGTIGYHFDPNSWRNEVSVCHSRPDTPILAEARATKLHSRAADSGMLNNSIFMSSPLLIDPNNVYTGKIQKRHDVRALDDTNGMSDYTAGNGPNFGPLELDTANTGDTRAHWRTQPISFGGFPRLFYGKIQPQDDADYKIWARIEGGSEGTDADNNWFGVLLDSTNTNAMIQYYDGGAQVYNKDSGVAIPTATNDIGFSIHMNGGGSPGESGASVWNTGQSSREAQAFTSATPDNWTNPRRPAIVVERTTATEKSMYIYFAHYAAEGFE